MSEQSLKDQADRYDREAQVHSEHMQDKWTQAYRDRFIRSYFDGLDLEGARVLDAMCASGVETGYLIDRGANVVGLDISSENAKLYEQIWGLPCKVASVHETGYDDESFDAVYVCGGLHHILPLLDETIAEVHRILRPGGKFMFVEPNADSWVNSIRKVWYEKSETFGDDERAISYRDELEPRMAGRFSEESLKYGGNVAYLSVGQSHTLGIPKSLKGAVAAVTQPIERISTIVPVLPRLFFVGVWSKVG